MEVRNAATTIWPKSFFVLKNKKKATKPCFFSKFEVWVFSWSIKRPPQVVRLLQTLFKRNVNISIHHMVIFKVIKNSNFLVKELNPLIKIPSIWIRALFPCSGELARLHILFKQHDFRQSSGKPLLIDMWHLKWSHVSI